ncbi:MAG: NYN domain-containing protein [Schwartzia sp.]|nr:NYN domain-containing protein [Schwartzia sp. (in: firmicutes)]
MNLQKMVLLVDADNTQLSKLEAVIEEVSLHGRIIVKRAYGNWKKDTLKNWEPELKRLAIKAEQQFDYVTGKNATDIALVIDAMHLLYRGIYDAFVIVASDSDYTPLALDLHESGVYVIGVGELKTPESFRNSCDDFIYLENMGDEPDEGGAEKEEESRVEKKTASKEESSKGGGQKTAQKAGEEKLRQPGKNAMKKVHALLRLAWDKYQDAEGYVNIGAAGSYIKRARPDFDVRSYGYHKLPQLIEAFPDRYKFKTSKKGHVFYRCT